MSYFIGLGDSAVRTAGPKNSSRALLFTTGTHWGNGSQSSLFSTEIHGDVGRVSDDGALFGHITAQKLSSCVASDWSIRPTFTALIEQNSPTT